MITRKSYNRAFKEDAVRFAEKSGATQVASNLGIHPQHDFCLEKTTGEKCEQDVPWH